MMRLSISSVVTTVVLVSAIIGLCCLLIGSGKFLRYVGTRWVKVLFICILIRIFLPLEFFYTYTVPCERVFTIIRTVLTWPVIPGNESLLLYHILLMIWGAGILYRVWKNGRFYSRVKKEISLFEKEPDARILEEAKTLWKEYPELEKARIKICALVDSPLLFGIRHPVILLPEEGTISAEDIRYILGHEALHMRAHDTLRKVMIDMVCIIGWWNPLFGRLRRELFRVIEIDNDLKITERMAVRERAEYVACLCKTARNSVSQKHFGAISFSSEGGKELKNRFDFIMERIKGTQRIQWAACLAVIVGVFASWSVVFEPAFPVPEDVIEMTKDNTYVVEEGGKYRVYLNGEYTFTTDTLEYFPKDVTVYKEEK